MSKTKQTETKQHKQRSPGASEETNKQQQLGLSLGPSNGQKTRLTAEQRWGAHWGVNALTSHPPSARRRLSFHNSPGPGPTAKHRPQNQSRPTYIHPETPGRGTAGRPFRVGVEATRNLPHGAEGHHASVRRELQLHTRLAAQVKCKVRESRGGAFAKLS